MNRIRASLLALTLTLGATGALGVAAGGKAHASSVAMLPLATLGARAERIVVAHVEAIDAHLLTPGSQRIVTDVTLVTEQEVFGQPSTRVLVRHLGGEVGRIGQLVPGEAHFTRGERVLLFAAKRQGVLFPVGMAQGVVHLYEAADGTTRAHTEGAPARQLADLVDEVRSLVGTRVQP